MKITKLEIHNLFGVKMRVLDGKSVELAGPKGSGKTSVLDSIRYALTNRSDREYIIRQGVGPGVVDVCCNNHAECYALTGYRAVYIIE